MIASDGGSISSRAAGGDGLTDGAVREFMVIDELRTANWQRSKAGQKNRNRPVPLNPRVRDKGRKKTGDAAGRSPAEVMALLPGRATK